MTTENERVILNVFGKEIVIKPAGLIVRVVKYSDNVVNVITEDQAYSKGTQPVNVMDKYGKTADEFIKEFESLNYKATSNDGLFIKGPISPAADKTTTE